VFKRFQACPHDLTTSHKRVRHPLRMALTGRGAFLCFWIPEVLHGSVFSGNSIRKDKGGFFPPCSSHLDQKSQLSSSTNPVLSIGSKSGEHSSTSDAGHWGRVRRYCFNALHAEIIESYVKEHLKSGKENLTSLAGALRKFFRYCASHGYIRSDLSGMIPSVRHYRHASLPKGIEDSALERVLDAIDKDFSKSS
jgi:hypothetical protein